MFEDDRKRYLALGIALVVIGAAILAIEAPWRTSSTVPEAPDDAPQSALDQPGAPNFAGATGWLNGGPVNLTEQRGEVVLVDFWTYSCINCIHTFPHLRAWHEHYDDHGLEVVGVHTPEFRFERDPANVQQALDRYNLTHPIALDNEYEIWDAYHTRFWPSKYLIDQYGRIQYSWAGEGGYDAMEDEIRRLLRQANHSVPDERVEVDERTGGYTGQQTPELFMAPIDEQTTSAIGNAEGYQQGETITYEIPEDPAEDRVYLEGRWYNGNESVRALSNASLLLDFHAGAANMVAGGPGECVQVRLDGDVINASAAARDVAIANGTACVPVEEKRSYDLYADPVGRHTLELDVPEGFELYTFAFSKEGRE